jgi:hypothetical protein
MGETAPQVNKLSISEDWGLQELRNAALHAALEIYRQQEDHQMVIRAAREFFTFLKDG